MSGPVPIAAASDDTGGLPDRARECDAKPPTASPVHGRASAGDAYTIADAAQAMPHTPRRVDISQARLAEMHVLSAFDRELAAATARLTNHSASSSPRYLTLERILGPHIHTTAVLTLLRRYGGPARTPAAGSEHGTLGAYRRQRTCHPCRRG